MLRARDPNLVPAAPAVKIPTRGAGAAESAHPPSAEPASAAPTPTPRVTFSRGTAFMGSASAFSTTAPARQPAVTPVALSPSPSTTLTRPAGRSELRVFECGPEPSSGRASKVCSTASPRPDPSPSAEGPQSLCRTLTGATSPPPPSAPSSPHGRSPSPVPVVPASFSAGVAHRQTRPSKRVVSWGGRPAPVTEGDRSGGDLPVDISAVGPAQDCSIGREFLPDHMLTNEDFIERLVGEVRRSISPEALRDGDDGEDVEVLACLRCARAPWARSPAPSRGRSRSPSPCVEAVVLTAPATGPGRRVGQARTPLSAPATNRRGPPAQTSRNSSPPAHPSSPPARLPAAEDGTRRDVGAGGWARPPHEAGVSPERHGTERSGTGEGQGPAQAYPTEASRRSPSRSLSPPCWRRPSPSPALAGRPAWNQRQPPARAIPAAGVVDGEAGRPQHRHRSPTSFSSTTAAAVTAARPASEAGTLSPPTPATAVVRVDSRSPSMAAPLPASPRARGAAAVMAETASSAAKRLAAHVRAVPTAGGSRGGGGGHNCRSRSRSAPRSDPIGTGTASPRVLGEGDRAAPTTATAPSVDSSPQPPSARELFADGLSPLSTCGGPSRIPARVEPLAAATAAVAAESPLFAGLLQSAQAATARALLAEARCAELEARLRRVEAAWEADRDAVGSRLAQLAGQVEFATRWIHAFDPSGAPAAPHTAPEPASPVGSPTARGVTVSSESAGSRPASAHTAAAEDGSRSVSSTDDGGGAEESRHSDAKGDCTNPRCTRTAETGTSPGFPGATPTPAKSDRSSGSVMRHPPSPPLVLHLRQ